MQGFLLDHPVAALFVDMSLGKTAAVLSVLAKMFLDGGSRGALIIAPLRVSILTWPNEISQWFPWLKIAQLRTAAGMAAWRKGGAHIYLLNYELLPKFCEELKSKRSLPVDTVVWDEISKAKDPASKRIKAFRPHYGRFTRHWGMTGTPVANSYLDLFAPMRLLDGGVRLGRRVTDYKERYFDPDYMGWNWTIKPWAREAIHEKIADITLTLKAEDYLHIPPTRLDDIDVVLAPDIQRAYRKMAKEFLVKIDTKEIIGANAAVLVGKLLQFTSGAMYDEDRKVHWIHDSKIEALAKLWKSIGHKPLLVCTSFIHERDRLMKWFGPQGAEVFETSSLERWNRKEIPMLLADPRSIGHGLNAQHGGHHICWFTPTYSRELYDQTNARLARLGQTEEVVVHRLLCRETGDWAVVEALRAKGNELSGLKEALKNLRMLA